MQKMTPDQFKDWKEHSEFFFNHIQEIIDLCPERLQDVAEVLAQANPGETAKAHSMAIMVVHKRDVLREILGLTHEDVFGGDDE